MQRPPGSLRRLEFGLPAIGCSAVAVTVVIGLLIEAGSRVGLGTPLPPFLMSWAPVFGAPALVSVAVLLGAAVLAARVIEMSWRPAVFAAFLYGLTLVLGLALSFGRTGMTGWAHVFDLGPKGSFEAIFEYLPVLPIVHRGIGPYIGHFPQLLPYLTTHTKGNPPGPAVLMELLHINTADRLAAVCIAVGSLVAPLAYALGRTLHDDRRGRVAGLLTACSPAVLLFGVTSVDYTFAALGVAAAWLMLSPRSGPRLGGLGLAAVGSFFSWLLLAIPVWAVLVVWKRDGPRRAVALALGAGAALLAVNGLLALLYGYDPIAIVRALAPIYHHGAAAHRPWAFWLFGSPAAWLIMLGLPVAWLSLRSAARGDPAALALVAIVVVAAVGGFTKAETERIWLPFVPLACVSAAAAPIGRLRGVLLALVLQGLAIELLFNTVW